MSLVPTMGAVLLGDMISAALYGLTTQQIFVYFNNSWDIDGWKLKVYVLFIWLLETCHVFLITAFIFRSVIIEFGNPEALLVTRVSDDVTTAITGLIIFSVHMFYVRRLWILSNRNIFLVGIVTILAFVHLAFEFVVMVLTFKFPLFSQFHKITPYYTGSLALAASNDIIIAVSMTWLLRSRRTGIRSTNNLVNRIITYSVMTGALTSVVDLAILICFVTMPNNLVYLAMFNLVNNLYANSLLAMLNARESLGRIVKGHANSIDTKATRATSSFALSAMRSGAGRGTNDSSSSEGRQPIQLSSQIEFAPVKRDGKYPTTTLTEYDPSP